MSLRWTVSIRLAAAALLEIENRELRCQAMLLEKALQEIHSSSWVVFSVSGDG